MRTTLCTLNTIVCKNTKSRIQFSRTAFDGLGCCTNGKDTFAQLCPEVLVVDAVFAI